MGFTWETAVSTVDGGHKIADLNLRDARDSADQGAHFRESQIQRGLLHGSLACLDGRFSRQLRLRVGVELALRNRARLRFGNIALYVERGVAELRFRLRELCLCLIQHRLERPRIDLKEHIVFVHEGAFAIVLLDEISGDLRLYLRIHVPIERGNPLAVDAARLFGPHLRLPLPGLRRLRGRRLLAASGA